VPRIPRRRRRRGRDSSSTSCCAPRRRGARAPGSARSDTIVMFSGKDEAQYENARRDRRVSRLPRAGARLSPPVAGFAHRTTARGPGRAQHWGQAEWEPRTSEFVQRSAELMLLRRLGLPDLLVCKQALGRGTSRCRVGAAHKHLCFPYRPRIRRGRRARRMDKSVALVLRQHRTARRSRPWRTSAVAQGGGRGTWDAIAPRSSVGDTRLPRSLQTANALLPLPPIARRLGRGSRKISAAARWERQHQLRSRLDTQSTDAARPRRPRISSPELTRVLRAGLGLQHQPRPRSGPLTVRRRAALTPPFMIRAADPGYLLFAFARSQTVSRVGWNSKW